MGRTDGAKKGSQLSQLKQSIRTSGLSRVSKTAERSGKKVKSFVSSATKDPEFRLKKLAEIQASQNLFDLKTSKVKFPTSSLSQTRNKGSSRDGNPAIRTVGKPTQSATQAHQRRVEKLLPEFRNRHKSSNFHDKRFGEGDSSLTPEEKALERFTKERQMRLPAGGKRNIFNLEDDAAGLYNEDEEGNGGLTHGGVELGLDDEDYGDGDEGILKLSKRPLALDELDDSNNDNEPTQKKSKAEVMSEIITKSKAHKYERQQLKDQDEALRYDLDTELKDIRALLIQSSANPTIRCPTDDRPGTEASSKLSNLSNQGSKLDHKNPGTTGDRISTTSETGDTSESISKNTAIPSESNIDQVLLSKLLGSAERTPSPEPLVPDKDEDMYDRFVRELAFDARAKPSDRLKTAEEEALEEAERLRMLEQKRLNRMRGMEDEDEEDVGGGNGKRASKPKRKPQADDLDDDFVLDEEYGGPGELGQGLRPDGAFGASAQSDASSFEETSSSHSDCVSGSVSDDGLSSDVDEWGGISETARHDADDHDDHLTHHSLVSSTSREKPREASNTQDPTPELAYTYPCPASHSEFLSILSQKSVKNSDVPTVVQRIRILYHPSLGEDNKSKLSIFTNVLIDHVIHITSLHSSSSSTSPFILVDALLPHIISLCQSFTQSAATHFISKLAIMQKNLSLALANQDGTGWPGLCELTLLRLIGVIWSTSDFSHPVVAPAFILMCQYLNQLQVKEYKNMISGLFMCTLILQYETLSKRLVPEAINFLLLSVIRLTSKKLELASIPFTLPVPEGTRTLLFSSTDQTPTDLQPCSVDFVSLLTKDSSSDTTSPSEQDRVDVLDVVISLLTNYSTLYKSSNHYIEIFTTVLSVVKSIDDGAKICQVTKIRLEELLETIDAQLASSRRIRQLNPLRLQSHRPIAIKAQTPQFESTFTPNQKAFNPDSAQVEVNKLKALIKKEKKGAMRELRKDNKFLAIEKAKEKDQADMAYNSKIARITAGLQQERSEEKKQERTKVRLKKLDKLRGSKK